MSGEDLSDYAVSGTKAVDEDSGKQAIEDSDPSTYRDDKDVLNPGNSVQFADNSKDMPLDPRDSGIAGETVSAQSGEPLPTTLETKNASFDTRGGKEGKGGKSGLTRGSDVYDRMAEDDPAHTKDVTT